VNDGRNRSRPLSSDFFARRGRKPALAALH
jgi:hypothetical protein